MGVVEDDAQVDDQAIVAEGARVGGREILLYDEIARHETQQGLTPMRPKRWMREESRCAI
jgi:hypothetical protein